MWPILFCTLLFVSSSSTVPLSDFFPYGREVGDSTLDPSDISEDPFHLPYTFPYFDNMYRKIWITANGLLSFLPLNYYHYMVEPFPLSNDASIIAGFWHEIIDSNFSNTKSNVYYQIHSNTSSSNFSMKVFTKASDYVRNFFPQQRPFKPKMVITGTWYYIGIEINATKQLNYPFQVVLCTDEDRSFVFFLYHDLQWANPYNNPYSMTQAGFYNSERNITETLPYSGTDNIVKLVNESNVNIPGLFAFRVDANKINAGGCSENGSMVSFRPRISSQFGSTPLTIYGSCFTNQTKVKCRFNSSSETVNGLVIDEFRAICLTPFASMYGSIPVSISINNGQTFISAGTFTYVPLQIGSNEVTIEMEDRNPLLHVGQYIKLTWHFSEIVKNTFPNGTKIDIKLWKLSLNQNQQLIKDNTSVILLQNLPLTDSVRFQLPSNISSISTCFIQVIVHFNSQIYAGLNTGILIVKSHPSLALELCQNWASQQPEPSTWNSDDFLPCPMTRSQAIAAGRCCYEPDQQCYKNNPNSNNCWLHQARPQHDEPSAVECYLSITSNRHGAGTECCYDNDTMLITRGTGAGTDDRYKSVTSPIQHFLHDTLPYLQCCVMSTNNQACEKYMHYRPPRRGSNTMGENGRMWGDPHFGTLDGMSYTFNGYGEYTYLAISNNPSPPVAFDDINQSYIFMSQIRTIPLSTNNVTVTKGFAARSNDAQAKPMSLIISHREQLILRRENELLEFEDNINTLFFPEVTITRHDGNTNSHFSLSWNIGVTIEINVIKLKSSSLSSDQLLLNIGASVSGIFRGRTYGLLGTYDGNATNDLRNKNGSIISNTVSSKEIHTNFGMTWAINSSKTLFHYESNESSQFFYEKNRHFVPSFIDLTNSTTNNASIRTFCEINVTSSPSSWSMAQRTCYYDFFVTNDKDFAQSSFNAGNELLSIRENQRNPPSFSSSLPLSMNLVSGNKTQLNISASSEYLSHAVQLLDLHRPRDSTFNRSTGIFKWTAIKGEHHLSIVAHDIIYNLKSRHEISFNVNAPDTPNNVNTTRKPNNGGYSQFNEANFIVSILGMFLLFCS